MTKRYGMHNHVHPDCVVCSEGNAKGLHLKFESADDGSIRGFFECDKTYEGYPGVLHGGILTSILDGAMGNCLFSRGKTAVTVEMNTRFKHAVEINKPAIVTARIVKISYPLYFMEAEISQNEKVKVVAKSKFYDRPELAKVIEAR
jgi:uncharacterized protein (TIGR00369 family)